MRNLIIKGCLSATILLCSTLPREVIASAEENKLSLEGAVGYESNVYYASTGEQGSMFGLLDAGYRYNRPLPNSEWNFFFDGLYSAKLFVSETGANDHFASLFMSVNRDFGNWQLGVTNDPQFTRFVTSDSNGGTLSSGRQRIFSDKIRVFSIIELSDSSEIEGALGFKTRDYKDSDSDHSEVSIDFVYRRRVSESTRLNAGILYERRDFKNRAATDATGREVADRTLFLKRLRPFIKVNYSPDKKSEYSFKYKYKSNVDSFEDWYSYQENSFFGQAKYVLAKGISLQGSVRLDLRDYEKRPGDTGGALGERITTARLRASLPATFNKSFWFVSVEQSGFSSDEKRFEYDNSAVMVGLKIER